MRPNRQSVPPRGPRPLTRWAALAGMLAGIAGCRSAAPSAPPPEPAGAIAVPAAALTPGACRLSEPGRTVYRTRLGGGDRYLLIERSPTPIQPTSLSAWTVRRSEGSTPDGPWTWTVEQSFVTTDRGDAAIASEINHTEGVELTFTPPMIVMPVSLGADGSEFTQSIRLRVSPIGEPDQTKARGPVRVTIRHEGADALDVDGVALPAQRVVRTFAAQLAPADVVNTTQQWFVPGRGLVADTREEHTRVFGVPTRNNRESWVIIEGPPRP